MSLVPNDWELYDRVVKLEKDIELSIGVLSDAIQDLKKEIDDLKKIQAWQGQFTIKYRYRFMRKLREEIDELREKVDCNNKACGVDIKGVDKDIDSLKEQIESLKGFSYNQSDDKWETIKIIEEVLRELLKRMEFVARDDFDSDRGRKASAIYTKLLSKLDDSESKPILYEYMTTMQKNQYKNDGEKSELVVGTGGASPTRNEECERPTILNKSDDSQPSKPKYQGYVDVEFNRNETKWKDIRKEPTDEELFKQGRRGGGTAILGYEDPIIIEKEDLEWLFELSKKPAWHRLEDMKHEGLKNRYLGDEK